MEDIIAAIFAQQMQPKQIEVDEMGMGGDGDLNSLAKMLMGGSTDVSMGVTPQKFKVSNTFGNKPKNDTTTLAPSYGQW